MREIQDLEHFVLQPGETLILRCKRHVTEETLARMRESVAKLGTGVIVLPPDIEAFAGKIEVFGVDHGERQPTQDDNNAPDICDVVQQAYDAGKIVWGLDSTGWFCIHHTLYPHQFDWNQYDYRLTKPQGY